MPLKVDTSGPEWLWNVTFRGFEGDEGTEGENEGEKGDEEVEEEPKGDDDLTKVKKALAAERLKTKRLEREVKAKGKAEPEEDEEEVEEQEKTKVKAKGERTPSVASLKLQKLTEGFRTMTLKTTVADLAKQFQDPADVLAHLDTSLISYEQDDDDPSIVVWDEAELGAAIKDLAKRKPYLLKSADGQQQGGKKVGRPSGSKFAGTGAKTTTDQAQLEQLRGRFPAMRGVRPNKTT